MRRSVLLGIALMPVVCFGMKRERTDEEEYRETKRANLEIVDEQTILSDLSLELYGLIKAVGMAPMVYPTASTPLFWVICLVHSLLNWVLMER